MKQSRIDLLNKIYAWNQSRGEPLQINFEDEETGEYIANLSALQNDVNYLEREGYLIEPIGISSAFVLSLTEKGERFVENGCTVPSEAPVPTMQFNMGGATLNNAMLGNNTVTGSTLNVSAGAALADLEKLIAAKPAQDQVMLQEMLEILREMQRTEKPIEKGRLAHFYELVKKGSDLLLPIGQFLTSFIFGIPG